MRKEKLVLLNNRLNDRLSHCDGPCCPLKIGEKQFISIVVYCMMKRPLDIEVKRQTYGQTSMFKPYKLTLIANANIQILF